jgi:hypothetical protein
MRYRCGDLRTTLDIDERVVDANHVESGERLDDFRTELPRRSDYERAVKN